MVFCSENKLVLPLSFFFFQLFELFPVCLEVFTKLLENKFSCAFSSQKTHKNFIAKDRGKIALSCLSASTPDIEVFPSNFPPY